MKLLIALVTYNRLEYTLRTVKSLLRTIQVPYYFVVVDNNSTDGTQLYLEDLHHLALCHKVILNPDNYYPGKATNIAWAEGLKDYPEATHLMRCDNDMHFEKGWDLKAQEYFEKIDRLGQLGLDYWGGEEKPPIIINGMGLNEYPGAVGGPNIIKRSIWNGGVRYDESRWEGSREKVQEDSRLSRDIKSYGYLVGHMSEKLSWTFANESNWLDYPDYYLKTMYDRNYDDKVELIKKMKEGRND